MRRVRIGNLMRANGLHRQGHHRPRAAGDGKHPPTRRSTSTHFGRQQLHTAQQAGRRDSTGLPATRRRSAPSDSQSPCTAPRDLHQHPRPILRSEEPAIVFDCSAQAPLRRGRAFRSTRPHPSTCTIGTSPTSLRMPLRLTGIRRYRLTRIPTRSLDPEG